MPRMLVPITLNSRYTLRQGVQFVMDFADHMPFDFDDTL